MIVNDPYTSLLYIDFSRDSHKAGGSSFAQILNKLGDEVPSVTDPAYFREAFNTVQDLIRKDLVLAGHDISAGGMLTTLLEMCFSNTEGGISINLTAINEQDTVKLLFSQNPGIIIQVKDELDVAEILLESGISYYSIGHPVTERSLLVVNNDENFSFDIESMRDKWFSTSYLLDRKQCGPELALERFTHYKEHELNINLQQFEGTFKALGIDPERRKKTGIRAAIIREKGVNGDREMAYSLYLAGFDVKDVHMTDLISGRETLDDINIIVFVGGFSNSDVLGSAKGWAGAFMFNDTAKKTLDRFYSRKDTLSLGICNGCQLMAELDLIYPEHKERPHLLRNKSHKFESEFVTVKIQENHSVMLKDLSGMELGIWVAHGEGQFSLPYSEDKYHIPVKFSRHTYPANPNGSDYDVAGLCSDDGRHLVMMPHLERSLMPWQCGYYPEENRKDEVTPWIKAFINAWEWVKRNRL